MLAIRDACLAWPSFFLIDGFTIRRVASSGPPALN